MVRKSSSIALGSGGIIYALATSLLFSAAIYTQANLLFWALGLMIGGLIVSIGLMLIAMRGLELERLPATNGIVGETLTLRYLIRNRSRIPCFSLIIKETWSTSSTPKMMSRNRLNDTSDPLNEKPPRLLTKPIGWVFFLGRQQTFQAECQCWPVRRGPIRFDTVSISTSYPFGILRKTVRFHEPAEILIYPKLHRMKRGILSTLARQDLSGQRHIDRAGGMEDFFGLRPYLEGDPIRDIDWKHSAKSNSLVIREKTQPAPPRVMAVLDLQPATLQKIEKTSNHQSPRQRSRKSKRLHAGPTSKWNQLEALPPQLDAIEKAISLTASIICDAYLKGQQIGLRIDGPQSQTFHLHHSIPHRNQILQALALIDPESILNPAPTKAESSTNHFNLTTKPTDSQVRPSVIIRPGKSQPILRRAVARPTVLGSDDLEALVLKDDTNVNLLAMRPRLSARKHIMQESSPALIELSQEINESSQKLPKETVQDGRLS